MTCGNAKPAKVNALLAPNTPRSLAIDPCPRLVHRWPDLRLQWGRGCPFATEFQSVPIHSTVRYGDACFGDPVGGTSPVLVVHPTSFTYDGPADLSAPGAIAGVYGDLAADAARNQQILDD